MIEYIRFSLILFLFCCVASLGLSLVNKIAKPKILAQLEREEKSSLQEVIPNADTFEPTKKGDETYYYKAFNAGKNLIGSAFKVQPKGYASQIVTMVGIDLEGKVIALKILEHNETPGIGSKLNEIKKTQTIWDKIRGKSKEVEKQTPWFLERFKGKDVVRLDKEVEAITGATISSGAVIKSIKEKGTEILKNGAR